LVYVFYSKKTSASRATTCRTVCAMTGNYFGRESGYLDWDVLGFGFID
jgi:hypothetical protein